MGCKPRESTSFDETVDEHVTVVDELDNVIAEPTSADAVGLLFVVRRLDLFIENVNVDGTDDDVSWVFVWTMKSFVRDNDVETNEVGVENELDESDGRTDEIVDILFEFEVFVLLLLLLFDVYSQPDSVLNWLKWPKRRASQ